MRKPRDFNSELQALTEKTKSLRNRKVLQLGELVIATGADALDPEMLTGLLLDAISTKDADQREAWRANGAAFFRVQSRKRAARPATNAAGDQAQQSDGIAP